MTGTSSSLLRHLRYCSLRFGDCRLVEVTARLRSGAAVPDRSWFPAPLDGILEHAARRRRLGGSYGLVVDHHREALPLTSTAGARPDGQPRFAKNRWVWAATGAWWPGAAPVDVRWVHKRPWDILAADATGIDAGGTPANPDVGRYKAQRLPVPVTVTAALTWWCIGDPDGVRDLLDEVDAVGKKHNIGEGQVAAWEVADVGDPDWERVCWLPDGRIGRPFHPRHAAALGLDPATVETVTVDAYRPPYWRPGIRDTGRRELTEVIAPWTTRP